MKAQLQKKISEIDNLFEETILSKKNTTHQNNISSQADEDKVLFLLENNLLSQLGKLEAIGYEFQKEHKKKYYEKLYISIINNPEDTMREYLKQGIELPKILLPICFIVDMQKSQEKESFGVKKAIVSFIDKVKKGLQTDPVANYKMEKLKDKQFVNEIFDVWYQSSLEHFEDIKTHVVNKKKFLWFYYNKSKSTMTKDIHKFTDNLLQKHIVNHHNYFHLPIMNEFFLQSVGVEKLLTAKEVLKMHDEVYDLVVSNNYHIHGSTVRSWLSQIKIADIELSEICIKYLDKQVKEYYAAQGDNILKDIEETNQEQYIKHTVNRKLVQQLDQKLLNELPNDAIEMIEQIKQISEHLSLKPIDEDTKEIIEFLWKEKLPEVMNKYLEIDNRYRQSLKNVQGKNAQELMLESLTVIKESLDLIEKDINEENLKNLSIHTRYLKNSLKN